MLPAGRAVARPCLRSVAPAALLRRTGKNFDLADCKKLDVELLAGVFKLSLNVSTVLDWKSRRMASTREDRMVDGEETRIS